FQQRFSVDRQRLMKNVALDATSVQKCDPHGMDGALDAATNGDALRNDVALDFRAIADHKIRGTQLAFDAAEDLSGTIAVDLADDRHAGANARVGPDLLCVRFRPRRGLLIDQIGWRHDPVYGLDRFCGGALSGAGCWGRTGVLLRCLTLKHDDLLFAGMTCATKNADISATWQQGSFSTSRRG